MQEKTIIRFGYSKEILEKLKSRRYINTIVTVLWAIIDYWFLKYFLNKYSREIRKEGTKEIIIGVFIIFFIIDVIYYFYNLSRLSKIISNVINNVLELKETSICGVYNNNVLIAHSYRDFKLKYKEINNVEVKEGQLHIHSSIGLIKLAIDLPYEARRMILKEITQNETIFDPVFKDING